MLAERKANGARNALEEARSLLEQADRSRRQLEQDLSDTNEQLADSTNTSQALTAAKRKLENEVNNMNVSVKNILTDDKTQTMTIMFRLILMRWPTRPGCPRRRPDAP